VKRAVWLKSLSEFSDNGDDGGAGNAADLERLFGPRLAGVFAAATGGGGGSLETLWLPRRSGVRGGS